MSQKIVYCPCCGTFLHGRFCVQCGYDTEILKRNAGLRHVVDEDGGQNATFLPVEEPNDYDDAEPRRSEGDSLFTQNTAEEDFYSEISEDTEDKSLSAAPKDSEDTSFSAAPTDFENAAIYAMPRDAEEITPCSEAPKAQDDFPKTPEDSFFAQTFSAAQSHDSKPNSSGKNTQSEKTAFIKSNSSEDFSFSPRTAKKPQSFEILTKVMPYLGMFFAILSFLIMLAPYGSKISSDSNQSDNCIYQLASAFSVCGNLVILMILSNSFLFLTSLHSRNGNTVVYGIIGTLCELLSLIGIGLLLSKFAKNEYYSVSAGIYAYFTLTVLELLTFLTITTVAILKRKIKKQREQEPRVNLTKRKQSKPNPKKRFVIVAASVAGLAVIGVSIFCGFYFSNIFRDAKLNQIEIGDSTETVERILGKPNSATTLEWVYYDSSYQKIKRELSENMYSSKYEQLELDRSLMKYRRISIRFEYNKVVGVEYDATHVDAKSSIMKIYKKIKLNPSKLKYGETLTENSVVASIFYKDGSFKKYAVPYDSLMRVNTSNIGNCAVSWSDKWGKYNATIKITD